MNKQEIFDKVSRHLMTQNKKALDAESNCVYRADDGNKCAAGCLIPDDEYNPYFEGKGAGNIIFFLLNHIKNINLILDLQRIHDNSPVEEWREELICLANQEELIIPEWLKVIE